MFIISIFEKYEKSIRIYTENEKTMTLLYEIELEKLSD